MDERDTGDVNKKPLLAVIGVVVLVCVAGLAWTAWHITHGRPSGTARASRLPHDAFLVVTVDMAQARAWPTAASLRNTLAAPGADASPGTQDAARRYQEVISHCGFDPWQKVDGLSLGVDRTVLAGRSEADLATFIDGSFTTEQARQCLTWVATQNHRQVTPGEVSHHPVLTSVRDGAAGQRTQQFALLDHTVMFADQTYMAHALAVVDGAAPGLPADSTLTRMLERLGPSNLVNAMVDVTAVRAQNARDIDSAVDTLVHDNPTAPNLVLLKQVQTGGLAVRGGNNAVTVTARLDLPDGGAAGTLTAALNSLVTARRGDLGQAIDQAQASVTQMQAMMALGGSNTDLSRQFQQAGQGFAAVRQVLNQIHVAADGRTSVVTVDFTPQQVSALDAGVRAMAEIVAEVSHSMRGFPGMQQPERSPGAGPAVPGLPF